MLVFQLLMRLAVSSGAFSDMPLAGMISTCDREGWVLEFSSGLPHAPSLVDDFLSASCRKLVHNYFPAPEKPFVLNLASCDSEVFEKSINHAKQGLSLAKRAAWPVYSVHAGFCLDPSPEHLGRPFDLKRHAPCSRHWSAFIEGLNILADYAEKTDTQLLIENNVLAPFNYRGDPNDVATLCAHPNEAIEMFESVHSDRVGLLLDTGHLKVSANTLGFDLHEAVDRLIPYLRMVHHSDNDGTEDTNSPLNENYWFLRHMSKLSRETIHVLEVNRLTPEQIRLQLDLLANAGVA